MIWFGFSSLTAVNFFTTNFICGFEMSKYPFDTQRCTPTFFLKGPDRDMVEFVSENVIYEGPKTVLQYIIKNITMAEVLLLEDFMKNLSLNI